MLTILILNSFLQYGVASSLNNVFMVLISYYMRSSLSAFLPAFVIKLICSQYQCMQRN